MTREWLLMLGMAAAAGGWLHAQSAPVPIVTSGSADCDRVVHDKLVGAQNRSPSECEVKFDLQLREAEHQTFVRAVAALAQDLWIIKSETPVKAITGVARNTEKQLFRQGATNGGGYELALALDPASAKAQTFAARWHEADDKVSEEVKATGKADGPAFVAFMKLNAEIAAASKITATVSVNVQAHEFVSFTAEHSLLQVPAATYSVTAPRVQALSGGDAGSAGPATFIYLGKWQPPAFEKLSDGGERTRVKSTIEVTASSPLSVQTVIIRLESSAALRDSLLANIDLGPLRALLAR
jgi:hypothetical protein